MQNNNVRIKYPKIEGTAQLFTDEFINYLLALHDHFSDRIKAIRTVRQPVSYTHLRAHET